MRLKRLTGLLVSLAVLSMGAPAPAAESDAAGDWPCWMGPNHDGKSPDKGLLKEWPKDGPKQLWKATGIGRGFSSVAVAKGKVYITGQDAGKLNLSAFDLEGKLLWKVDCGQAVDDGRGGSPAVDGDRIYTSDGNGSLTCLDAETGTKKWSRDTRKDFGGNPGGWKYAESPLVLGDLVIFKPGGKSCIVALEKATGKDVWASTGFSAGPEYGSCTPFVHEGVQMVVAGTNAGLVCVDAKTGKMLWKNGFSAGNTANCPTPLYSDGYVFWANGYGKGGVCVKLEADGTAKEAYKTRDMQCHHGGFIIDKGYVYGNNGGGFACLELKTGKKMWNENGGVGKGSLCWADGMLYLFGEGGGKAALATCTPEGLKVTGKVEVKGDGPSWAHPVVASGCLFLRFGDNLYCFDVKAK